METGKELQEFKEIINKQNNIMKIQALEIENLKKSLENHTMFIRTWIEQSAVQNPKWDDQKSIYRNCENSKMLWESLGTA